jgi:hypothetical protein
VPVEIAAAGHRAFAPDVQGPESIELAGIGLSCDHPILLLHSGVGSRRLHTAEFEGRSRVLVEFGQYRRGLDRLGREAQRRHRAQRAGRFWDERAILGDQYACDPVIGPRALNVVLNHGDAGHLPILDRLMQLVDRRFFETKRLCICHEHKLASS